MASRKLLGPRSMDDRNGFLDLILRESFISTWALLASQSIAGHVVVYFATGSSTVGRNVLAERHLPNSKKWMTIIRPRLFARAAIVRVVSIAFLQSIAKVHTPCMTPEILKFA